MKMNDDAFKGVLENKQLCIGLYITKFSVTRY